MSEVGSPVPLLTLQPRPWSCYFLSWDDLQDHIERPPSLLRWCPWSHDHIVQCPLSLLLELPYIWGLDSQQRGPSIVTRIVSKEMHCLWTWLGFCREQRALCHNVRPHWHQLTLCLLLVIYKKWKQTERSAEACWLFTDWRQQYLEFWWVMKFQGYNSRTWRYSVRYYQAGNFVNCCIVRQAASIWRNDIRI